MPTTRRTSRRRPAAAQSETTEPTTPEVAAEEQPAAQAEPVTPEPEPQSLKATLIVMGSSPAPYELSPGATVGDLLSAAGQSVKNGSVLVNNKHAALEDVIPDEATVVFATKIKGGRS